MKNLFQAFRPLLSDLLSTILFVLVYAVTGSIYIATAFGIFIGIAQIAYMKIKSRDVQTMQWMSLVLVIVLGTATLLTRDPRFVMIKPSVGAFAVGMVMLKKNWMGRYLPPIVTTNVSPSFVIAWGYVWAANLFALGAANLFVAFDRHRAISIRSIHRPHSAAMMGG